MPLPCSKRECLLGLFLLGQGHSPQQVADRLSRHVQTIGSTASRAERGERVVLKGKKGTVSLNSKFNSITLDECAGEECQSLAGDRLVKERACSNALKLMQDRCSGKHARLFALHCMAAVLQITARA